MVALEIILTFQNPLVPGLFTLFEQCLRRTGGSSSQGLMQTCSSSVSAAGTGTVSGFVPLYSPHCPDSQLAVKRWSSRLCRQWRVSFAKFDLPTVLPSPSPPRSVSTEAVCLFLLMSQAHVRPAVMGQPQKKGDLFLQRACVAISAVVEVFIVSCLPLATHQWALSCRLFDGLSRKPTSSIGGTENRK